MSNDGKPAPVAFLCHGSEDDEFADPFHLNARGREKFTDVLSEQLRPLLGAP